MSTLNKRISTLEEEILSLKKQLIDVINSTDTKEKSPRTMVGGSKVTGTTFPVDASSGLSAISGSSAVVWNNTEIVTPYGTQPLQPKIGYNKHTHSRFSGGALIKGVIEIVEYAWGGITNPHSQGFLKPQNAPQIEKTTNTNGEHVDKIGELDLVFNPDTLTWGTPAYEIDVRRCSLVMRDENGDIELDSNGVEKKSPLYSADPTKSSVVWDVKGQCFRFYAVYAPDGSQI